MRAVKAAAAERRQYERRRSIGSVYFWWDEIAGIEARGTLLDESQGGFRAVHHCQELKAGQLVGIRIGGIESRARVVWTRVMGEVVESGFWVLPTGPGGPVALRET